MPQALKTLCLIQFWSWKNSLFPLLALWGNRKWLSIWLDAPFFSKFLQLFHFHTGRPILITPEGQLWEKGILPTSKLNEREGFQCLGNSNWTICSPMSHFCSEFGRIWLEDLIFGWIPNKWIGKSDYNPDKWLGIFILGFDWGSNPPLQLVSFSVMAHIAEIQA